MTKPAHEQAKSCIDVSPSAVWNGQTLDRSAQLLADGQMRWPKDLSGRQAKQLLVETRRRLRTRLVRFIADRIAAHTLESLNPQNTEYNRHDQGPFRSE